MAQGSTALAPMGMRQARRLGLKAAELLLGGGRAAADAIGVNERSWRAWRAGEREIADGVLTDVAAALERHACDCRERAGKLRELAGAAHLNKEPPTSSADDAALKAARLERFKALPRELQLRVAKGLIELDAAEREAGDAD